MRIALIKLVFVGLHKIVLSHLINLGEDTLGEAFNKSLSNRIFNGDDATLEEFPFLVQFLNHGGLCAGTILTTKTVMTAAHCFDANTDLNKMIVFSHSRYIFDSSGAAHNVFDYIIHEDYVETEFSKDIAIVMIVDSFEYGIYENKAKLTDTLKWMNQSVNVIAAGWGETKYGGESRPDPSVLLKATTLHYVPKVDCAFAQNVRLTPEMLCLYSDQHQDACRGDSGGGVVWNGTIIGIVSHGNGCGKTPAVYMNVYYFRQWIARAVATLNNNFCKHLEKLQASIILLRKKLR